MKGLVGLYLKRPINICLQSARLISQECGISISNMMSNQNLTIYTSHSKCIYENLAFEEWIFRKHDFEGKGDVVLLWSNSPSIVIGRHQNLWLEANIRYCEQNDIKIARRYSGGGAVYHDRGNLNISILTTQNNHCRKRNLSLLAENLNNALSLTAPIVRNDRDDLIFEPGGCKISGTAARISHGRAYHHLTLLVDVCIQRLHQALTPPLKDKIHTTASRSTPAKSVGVILQKLRKPIGAKELLRQVEAFVINSFQSQYKQTLVKHWNGPSIQASDYGSEDENYPGLVNEIRHLSSEEWIHGKTPPFTLRIYSSNIDTVYDIVVVSGKIKESLHRDFPVGVYFNRAILKTNFV